MAVQYGIRKGLEDIAYELKGIRDVMLAIWQVKYGEVDVDCLNPDAYADEYISTEECAKRLGVSDQTLRNWMSIGKKDPTKGWVEGLHYVNVSPVRGKKAVLRVPWNNLVRSFSKNEEFKPSDYRKKRSNMYALRGFQKQS